MRHRHLAPFFRLSLRFLLFCFISATLYANQPWAKKGAIRMGEKAFAPETEGIRKDQGQSPYLLLSPYPPATEANKAALQATLPRRGQTLLTPRAPYTLLAIGDSVTATGPYPEIVARHLEQLTGRTPGSILVHRAAYPGKSIDAAVRRWKQDSADVKADLILIMFGLNDQSVSSSPEAFVGQLNWLIAQGHETGADILLLEPTPHINIIPDKDEPQNAIAQASIFRTINFAGYLREATGQPLVAPTFSAIWGNGEAGSQWETQAQQLYPLYPTHYSKPWTTLEESAGKGDTIHPNITGHARLARAIVDRLLAGVKPPGTPLALQAQSQWREDGRLETLFSLHNQSSHPIHGTLHFYPFPQDDRHETRLYNLPPGARSETRLLWPKEIDGPQALLHFPAAAICLKGVPWIQVIDLQLNANGQAHSRPFSIPAPIAKAVHWRLPKDQSVTTAQEITLTSVGAMLELPLPTEGQVQRIPLPPAGEQELVAIRFAAATPGEAVADGQLDEWPEGETLWTPLGEPIQARWNRGPQDHRKSPEECLLHWAFRAGENGLWVAFRGRCSIEQDLFWLMFDAQTEDAQRIGEPAPYTWVTGRFNHNGALILRPGDSSPNKAAKGLHGHWKQGTNEGEITGELFIPYPVLNIEAWPENGDIGLSIVWAYAPANQPRTYLLWSADGFPWNTAGFGVLRRGAREPLPWKLRLR